MLTESVSVSLLAKLESLGCGVGLAWLRIRSRFVTESKSLVYGVGVAAYGGSLVVESLLAESESVSCGVAVAAYGVGVSARGVGVA